MACFSTLYLPTLYDSVKASSTEPGISADMLFPTPSPVQQTVDVYDPAPRSYDSHDSGDAGDRGDTGGVDH